MPWQLHLFVFSYGSLLCLVDSSVYRSGVQHDVPITSLAAAGCVHCYEANYGSATNSKDITSCTGPFLFVGTQQDVMPVLKIGALTSVEVLRTEASRSAPYLSNGVYLHFMKGCLFGFMAVEYGDDMIHEESRELFATAKDGVSWDIDQSIGCSALDEIKPQSIMDTSNWTKHIYNCPGLLLRHIFIICSCVIFFLLSNISGTLQQTKHRIHSLQNTQLQPYWANKIRKEQGQE